MFIVLRVKNCPMYIRGYLRRFLSEPDSGLFVGNCSTRVSDKIWERIINSEEHLTAYMVKSTSVNEQGFVFKSHNLANKNEIQDKDGILIFGYNYLSWENEEIDENADSENKELA